LQQKGDTSFDPPQYSLHLQLVCQTVGGQRGSPLSVATRQFLLTESSIMYYVSWRSTRLRSWVIKCFTPALVTSVQPRKFMLARWANLANCSTLACPMFVQPSRFMLARRVKLDSFFNASSFIWLQHMRIQYIPQMTKPKPGWLFVFLWRCWPWVSVNCSVFTRLALLSSLYRVVTAERNGRNPITAVLRRTFTLVNEWWVTSGVLNNIASVGGRSTLVRLMCTNPGKFGTFPLLRQTLEQIGIPHTSSPLVMERGLEIPNGWRKR
jgi:hypothetical protein